MVEEVPGQKSELADIRAKVSMGDLDPVSIVRAVVAFESQA